MIVRRPAPARRLCAALLFTGLAVMSSGCDRLKRGEAPDVTGEVDVAQTGFGPCWPTYGQDVISASTNRMGQSLMVVEAKPVAWKGEWNSKWRSLDVVDLAANPVKVRYLAHTWETGETIAMAATQVPGSAPSLGVPVVEQLAVVAVGVNSSAFVLGTLQEGRPGGYRYLYHGLIPPENNAEFDPTEGLSRIPINDPARIEFVRTFEVSPDGQRIAAIIGQVGELRIYDVAAGVPIIYDKDDGEIKVTHELPAANTLRTPGYATVGSVGMVWSPDGTMLALSRAEPGGQASLGLLDVGSGVLTHVRSFQNSTAPSVAWTADGSGLTIMYTPLDAAGHFGNTQFGRVQAKANAQDESAGEILRPLGYKTEPALLTSVDDSHFVFQWEDGVWQMTVEGGDLSAATAARATTSDQVSFYEPIGVAPELDLAAYRVTTKTHSRTVLGVRTNLASPTCPLEGEAKPNP